MARFTPNEPVVTREPKITVDAGLPVGRHRFRLEVVDTSGRRSVPSEAIVEVQPLIGPVQPPIVIEPVRPTPIVLPRGSRSRRR